MMFQTQSTKRKAPLLGPLFHLENVSIHFNNVRALQNIQMEIKKGEVLFITGASGAGKTTLLKVLSGEVEAHGGLARIPDNRTCFSAQVFQDLKLIEKFTCKENLEFAYDSTLYRSRKEFDRDLNELVRILGFSNRLDTKIKDANGGLKQKVAIVRALLARPEVFIADEPTSSLDAANASKLFEVLSLYNMKRGMTVIWATHNRELVKKFSGRIVHLENGRLVYSGHACFI